MTSTWCLLPANFLRQALIDSYRRLSRGERSGRGPHKFLTLARTRSNDKQIRLAASTRLQPFFENPQPVSAQRFFDLFVAETTLDHFASEVPRVRMVPQIGDEVRHSKFFVKLLFGRLRPLAVDELKEIKSNTHSIDADQIGYVFDMIDEVIENAFFCFWTNEHGVNANHTSAFPDHFDLVIVDVALDVVISSNIGVRNNGWFCCDRQNLVETGRIDVSKIDNHAEGLALSHQVTTKPGKALQR